MIFISSHCVKQRYIKDSIEILVKNGFKHIELSGGTRYYPHFENDIIQLKKDHQVEYLCHNYFPPPELPFVVNLASLNDDIYEKSLVHLKKALRLSQKLGAKRFGFHAGFFLDIHPQKVGENLNADSLFNKEQCIERFCDGFQELRKEAKEVELYLENNILSYDNFKTFGVCPLMMTTCQEYEELRKRIDFKLLLDIGHLKVSSHSLDLNFQHEWDRMVSASDYIHMSDNDGFSDQNKSIREESALFQMLKKTYLKNKIFTLEIYEDIQEIKKAYYLLEKLT